MGEILRHAEISANTIRRVSDLRADEEYVYLELGNFLTDISQFRDPVAFMSAKRTVWQEAKASNGLLNVLSHIPILGIIADLILDAVDIDDWIDDLLGRHAPPDKRYGDLAHYFEKMFLGVTHLLFANDVEKKGQLKPLLPSEMAALGSVPAAELERVFAAFFTQYYPHEHVDYPPYVWSGRQRPRASQYQRRSSGLIAYLEDYQWYLSEGLSQLEVEWKEQRGLAKTDPKRHDVLVKFGKLLHAVEDYFFHSNYVELHLWNDLRRTRPSSEADDAYKTWFAANALARYRTYAGYTGYDGDGADPDAGGLTRWRRKLMRRLRYPVYESNDQLSPESSAAGLPEGGGLQPKRDSPTVVTGGFEGNDVYHTMAEALESLELLLGRLDAAAEWLPADIRQALNIPSARALSTSDLVLIRTLFSRDERTRLAADEDYATRRLQLHIEQLHSGVYERGIDKFRAAGYLNDGAKNAFLAAFQIDKRLEDSNKRTPGVGGFLIKFLAKSQAEVNKSLAASGRLDAARDGRVLDERSDNGSTGEAIGTHTLLSKDTPKSQPLYEDARVLAHYASLAVATRMLAEVSRTTDTSTGLDWDQILRAYLRFPNARPGMWETQALAFYRRDGRMPAYTDVDDRPEFSPLPAADPRLLDRRRGTTRAALEKQYTDLEQKVDHR